MQKIYDARKKNAAIRLWLRYFRARVGAWGCVCGGVRMLVWGVCMFVFSYNLLISLI